MLCSLFVLQLSHTFSRTNPQKKESHCPENSFRSNVFLNLSYNSIYSLREILHIYTSTLTLSNKLNVHSQT
jgi:hypothetical protein